MQPLSGLLVLDFSTLLPGPLASLILAEAGARVLKIERPERGDEMRSYEPKIGDSSVNFLMLNRGKQSIALDLKGEGATAWLQPLIANADVLIEQFRPGVMQRLGLDYESVHQINPGLIYCSITGWGQTGPKSALAHHDLNYMAETGALGLAAGVDGSPPLPPVLAADVAGGAYPAVMNILLALRQRDLTGQGVHLDIAMGENLFPFLYAGLGSGFATQSWPLPGRALTTGASPRYQIYRAADDRYVAAAPLEDKFWENFCQLIELPPAYCDPEAPSEVVLQEVQKRIGAKTSAEWRALFADRDVCCSIVSSLDEAVSDPHFKARGVFSYRLSAHGRDIPALPVPVASVFRSPQIRSTAPRLGETHDPLLPESHAYTPESDQ